MREQLPGAAESLQRRRADLVPEPLIAELVGVNWLEWSGGSLRLTETGMNICKQLKAGIK